MLFVCADGVADAVGAYLLWVVDADRHPGLHPGLDDHRLEVEVVRNHLAHRESGAGDDAGNGDTGDVGVTRDAAEPQERENEQGKLVGGSLDLRAAAPGLDELVAVEDPDGRLGVADVDGQQHLLAPDPVEVQAHVERGSRVGEGADGDAIDTRGCDGVDVVESDSAGGFNESAGGPFADEPDKF